MRMSTLTADRCDECGRFMTHAAEVEESYRMNLYGDVDVDEYHYCQRCVDRSKVASRQLVATG